MLILSIVLILVAGALGILLLGLAQAADRGDRMAEKELEARKICPLCLEEYINGGAHFEECHGRVVREDLIDKTFRGGP